MLHTLLSLTVMGVSTEGTNERNPVKLTRKMKKKIIFPAFLFKSDPHL